jgi:hypothetical protein
MKLTKENILFVHTVYSVSFATAIIAQTAGIDKNIYWCITTITSHLVSRAYYGNYDATLYPLMWNNHAFFYAVNDFFE